MPKRLARNRFFIAGALIIALFWIIAPFLDRHLLLSIIQALSVSFGLGVLVVFLPIFMRSVTIGHDRYKDGQLLIIGVVLITACAVGRSSWSYFWLFLGKPAWMVDHIIPAFLAFLLTVGFVACLSVKDSIDGQLVVDSWRRIGIYLAWGLALVAVGVTLSF